MIRIRPLFKKLCVAALSTVIVAGAFAAPKMTAAKETKTESEYTFDYSKKTYKKDYKKFLFFGDTYMSLSYQYPEFTGSNEKAVNKINNYYTQRQKEWVENFSQYKKEAKEQATKDQCFGDEVKCSVTYLDRMYVSVVQTGYEYTMGAHGTPYKECHVFNVNTGKQVSAKTLLGVSSKKAVNEKARALFEKNFKKYENSDENPYYDTNMKDFRQTLSDMDFSNQYYINDEGQLTFYANVYDLGPYASGFRMVHTNWVYPTTTYKGVMDGNSDYCDLKMEQLSAEDYNTEIGLYRLTTLEGVTNTENGALIFQDTELGVTGKITVKDGKATFKVTESNWDLLEKGSTFQFEQ